MWATWRSSRKEFNEDLAAIAFAVKTYGLPDNLKLSVHSGSDKFSIYKAIHDAVIGVWRGRAFEDGRDYVARGVDRAGGGGWFGAGDCQGGLLGGVEPHGRADRTLCDGDRYRSDEAADGRKR